MSTSWNPPSTLYLLDVKIRNVHIQDINFTTVLRVGWLGSDTATYTRWKKAHDGTVGWKKPLVLRVEPRQEFISLVLFQKVGERSNPIAMKQIPLTQVVFESRVKRQFTFALEYLVDNYEGEIQGSLRASPQEGVSALERDMNSYAPSSTVLAMDGSAMSRSRSWLLQKNEISLSDSFSTTLPSVDLSLDFFGDIPNEFYPLITFVEVYSSVLKRHEEKIIGQNSAVRFLLELPEETTDFEVPVEYQIPLADGGQGFVEVFLELGLLLATSRSSAIEPGDYSCWNIDGRLCELPALHDAIELVLQEAMMTD